MEKQLVDDYNESEMFGNLKMPPKRTESALAKYSRFRIPGPHVKLATKGVYFPNGTIEMTIAGDIPVYAMGGDDEMLLKSPDALMSGLALEKLFESCIPSIKNPKLISAPDLDVLLIAIRVATYGDKMELNVVCPSCKKENCLDCDLPSLISTMKFLDEDNSVRLDDDVVAYIRPHNLEDATKIALVLFQETRRLQAIENQEMDNAEKSKELSDTMQKISVINKSVMAECVYKVVVPEAQVTNTVEIYEFLRTIPKSWLEKIEDKLRSMNESAIDKHVEIECIECKHKWKEVIEFDPANFFDAPSSTSQQTKK